MGEPRWNNWEIVKNLVESNGQSLLTTKEEFTEKVIIAEQTKWKIYGEIKISVTCKSCGKPYTVTINQYKRKNKEKLECNVCTGTEKWTLERIKKFLSENNSELLSSDGSYFEQLSSGCSPYEIKLIIKCKTCKNGVLENINMKRYIAKNQQECKECTGRKLSEKIKTQNIIQW